MKQKNFSLFFTLFSAAYSCFTWADIPYVHGIDYLPKHYNAYYDGENRNIALSDDDIEKDMFIMSQNFNAIRTYEYDPINLQRIIRTAKRYGMKVAVGIKINPTNSNETNNQIQGLNQMFEQYPDLLGPVITILVGNEVIRSGQNAEKDIAYLVKQFNTIAQFQWVKNSNLPLSISETDETILSPAGTTLLQSIPRHAPVFININPYLAGCTVNGAIRADSSCKNHSFPDMWALLTNDKTSPLLKTHQIIVGESGWPTEGPGMLTPIQTSNGNLADAVEYYQFLYGFLSQQQINHQPVAIPFFAFVAFDQPMNGIFGFATNFWGIYNADSTPKNGMIYPLERTVKPTPKLGTNLKISLINPYYNSAKAAVLFQTKQNIYSNRDTKTLKDNTGHKIYPFTNEPVFVEYSVDHSNIVTLTLPDTGNPNYPAAKCTNELLSGNGYGLKPSLTLEWARSFSKDKDEACKYVNWAENGIFIVGG